MMLNHLLGLQTKKNNSLHYSTNHSGTLLKQGATKLLKLINKYLLMTTFEYGDNYSIQNDHKNTIRSALAPLPHTR